jgi:hypothetical protein
MVTLNFYSSVTVFVLRSVATQNAGTVSGLRSSANFVAMCHSGEL